MTARLILICHASTAAMRSSSFPADEPLDEHGGVSAAALARHLPKADRWLTGLDAAVEPALRDCDYGSWSGRGFKDVYTSEPDAITAWLHAPAANLCPA